MEESQGHTGLSFTEQRARGREAEARGAQPGPPLAGFLLPFMAQATLALLLPGDIFLFFLLFCFIKV